MSKHTYDNDTTNTCVCIYIYIYIYVCIYLSLSLSLYIYIYTRKLPRSGCWTRGRASPRRSAQTQQQQQTIHNEQERNQTIYTQGGLGAEDCQSLHRTVEHLI